MPISRGRRRRTSELTAEEAAAYLRVSKSQFYRVVAPRIPRVQLSPRRIRYARSALDAWREQNGRRS